MDKISQEIPNNSVIEWLKEEMPIILFMGIVLYFLFKEYQKEREHNRSMLAKNIEAMITLTRVLNELFKFNKHNNKDEEEK